MSNNSDKIEALEDAGLQVVEQVPIEDRIKRTRRSLSSHEERKNGTSDSSDGRINFKLSA